MRDEPAPVRRRADDRERVPRALGQPREVRLATHDAEPQDPRGEGVGEAPAAAEAEREGVGRGGEARQTLGEVVQAVLGGLTVLFGLHPATVATHFLVSAVLVAVSTYLWRRATEPAGELAPLVPPLVRRAAALACAVGALVLVLGTVVTGSGPHSGDADTPARFGFDPRTISWLHADAVMLFTGLVIAMVLATHLVAADERPKRGWLLVLVVTLAQGLLGYVQYMTKLPEALVVAHMLGAALLVVALTMGTMSLRGAPSA